MRTQAVGTYRSQLKCRCFYLNLNIKKTLSSITSIGLLLQQQQYQQEKPITTSLSQIDSR